MGSDRNRHSIDERSQTQIVPRPRSLNIWRSGSLANLINGARRNRERVLISSTDTDVTTSTPEEPDKNGWLTSKESKKSWSTIVNVVVVEAKGLPDPPSDYASHNLYCKIRLGSETFKTKTVQSCHQPEWRERLRLHLKKDQLLRVSLWHKGRQKNFMGSCVIDLSNMERERTHEIWQPLDDGFGCVHLNVTMCNIKNNEDLTDNTPNFEEVKGNFSVLDFKDLDTVGYLHVKVIGARGLSGKPNAYCTLELDNSRVQTNAAKASSDPMWNKNYVFNVHDVTSTLDLKVYDSSLVSIRTESIGKISIPLLRIQNGVTRWYALKDRHKRNGAKGNCPRVLLEMSLVFNPVKASLRLFRPSEVKYIKKPPKFDVMLVYNNLLFVRGVFRFLFELNEALKRTFEWENRELSTLALIVWLVFWNFFRFWTAPLLLLLPFIFYWFNRKNDHEIYITRNHSNFVVENGQINEEKNEVSLASKIQGLPEVALEITRYIDYMVHVFERLFNLVSFKVPFLSYLTMILLVAASITVYIVPFNYLMMALGIYKYTRKCLNPERILNNDILDFISRSPDFETLKDWKELSVPEPHHHRLSSSRFLIRSNSNAQ